MSEEGVELNVIDIDGANLSVPSVLATRLHDLLYHVNKTLENVDSSGNSLLNEPNKFLLGLLSCQIRGSPGIVRDVVELVDPCCSSNVIHGYLRELLVLSNSLELREKALKLLPTIELVFPIRDAPFLRMELDNSVMRVNPVPVPKPCL